MAEIVVLPVPVPVANPPFEIVATEGVSDAHAAVLVTSCTLPSLYVPVAPNCCVRPAATEGFAGVTAIDTSTGGATLSVVEPVIDPELALTVVLPCATVCANPVPLIVATLCADELHVTEPVRFCVLPSV